ncbi:GTPase-activating protein [Elasticomyces elasticus]|nr:GTPase-activating protein [Elasticomyces elasticus]KAK3652735.1 GTPase-activating protein [Elasticomyces elasticus]KAK4908358.1 GTPase-activating protein [Elasticomyces elasticus]KAK5748398.1 GTPase-activating protein [Elasticomyces elasticus]
MSDLWAFIDRTDTASPFWRTASANSQRDSKPPTPGQSQTPERKVIGASYSHADILKFDDLSLSNSRPRTPPSLPRNRSTPPPNKSHNSGGVSTPPQRKGYSSFLSATDDAWEAEQNGHPQPEDQLTYNSDEDEFGLPSISSMRRKARNQQRPSTHKNGSTSSDHRSNGLAGTTLLPSSSSASWALDNGDVSLERSQTIPSYPSSSTSRGSESKILRPQYKDILQDPANSLHLISHPPVPPGATAKEHDAHSARITRINKFKKILQASSINLPELRNSAWSGLPPEVRAISWQLLLGYLPTSSERRVATLDRKRREYLSGISAAFSRPSTTSTSTNSNGRGLDEVIWHQISIDVPRTNPHLELYTYSTTHRSLERILYLWALRHPASGYVQGISDLVTPFYQTFLAQYITGSGSGTSIEAGFDPAQLPKSVLDAVEADSYWCLTKLLEGIQDNYIHLQPGITRQVSALRDLVWRIDAQLGRHLEREGVEFLQFSFRWMNCLLMREVRLGSVVRMWDTYLAEDQGFSAFHLYVCAAFLVKWSSQLMQMEFQEIMMFLQALPTRDWTEKDVELLLSEAFIWKSLFAGSQAHVVKTRGFELGGENGGEGGMI